jgi:hypothetical protein
MAAGRKKATRKKTTVKKAGRKKTTRKKTAAKKATRKKTTRKKTARKKTAAKKVTRKKTARKKTAAKKATRKKAAAKRPPAKKAAPKKVAKPATAKPRESGKPAESEAASAQKLEDAKTAAASPTRIGVVTHYFGKVGVGAIALESGELRVGDTIHVRGHTTDFYQRVDRIEIDHLPVEIARPGQSVGVEITQRVREHDEVFRVSD